MCRYAAPPGYFDDDVLSMFCAVPPDAIGGGADFGPPDHRWFLLGAKGSGSEVHQDPPHMSSWNACVVGRKRWAFVDPACGVTKAEVRGISEDEWGAR